MQLRNKVLKIVLSCLAVIPLLLPFQMYADTVLTSDNVVGINVYTTPVSEESFTQDNREFYKSTAIVNVDFELDKSYLGWINLGFVIKYKGHNLSSGWTDYTKTWSGNYYVNGSVIHIEVPISWNSVLSGYYMGTGHLPSSSSDLQNITYSNQGSITPIGDLSTLQDILDVLNVIQQNVEIDVLIELESIVTKLGLANQYLEAISNMRQWNVPFESYLPITFMLSKNYEILYINSYNRYQFPVFKLNAGDTAISVYGNTNNLIKYIMLVHSDAQSLNSFLNLYKVISPSNVDMSANIRNFRLINRANTVGNYPYSIIYFESLHTTSYTENIKSKVDNTPCVVLYAQNTKYSFQPSTDFALNFGLTNDLLDNLEIIAQGTTNSNNSSNNLESQNTQFSTDSSNLMNLEDTLGNQMNDNLQQIDTNFDVGNQFGSKFLASAEWVRNQYNTLTSNTPFGTFISFSLLIGLALLLMGRLL